jgi:hypothetical protein
MAGNFRNLPQSARAAFRSPSGTVCWLDESDIWFTTPQNEELEKLVRFFARIHQRYGQRFQGRDYDPDPLFTYAKFVCDMMDGTDLWVEEQPFVRDVIY